MCLYVQACLYIHIYMFIYLFIVCGWSYDGLGANPLKRLGLGLTLGMVCGERLVRKSWRIRIIGARWRLEGADEGGNHVNLLHWTTYKQDGQIQQYFRAANASKLT